MLGVAVASKVIAVGASTPFVQAEIGAICSQAYNSPKLGIRGLGLLTEGLTAEKTLERLLVEDEDRDWRQITIVDRRGGSAAFTGSRADPWKGTRVGPDYAIGGNLLTGEETVKSMEEAFRDLKDAAFSERLLRVLEAGDASGGDRRGKQSAAIYIVFRQPLPYLNLRVDDQPEPIQELRRIFEVAKNTPDFLASRLRLADEMQPRSSEENAELQRKLRKELGIPND